MNLLGFETFPKKWQGSLPPKRRSWRLKELRAGHRPGHRLLLELERCSSVRWRGRGFKKDLCGATTAWKWRSSGCQRAGLWPSRCGHSKQRCLCLEGLSSTTFRGSGWRGRRLWARPDLKLCESVFFSYFPKMLSRKFKCNYLNDGKWGTTTSKVLPLTWLRTWKHTEKWKRRWQKIEGKPISKQGSWK